MNKRIKSTLSILLMLALIISMMPVSVYAGISKRQKKYLFIGDSMTYNFVNGRHFYTSELDENGHYPAQVAGRMGYKILNNSGEAPREALTNGGVRTTDIYAFLSNTFDGDYYTQHEYDEGDWQGNSISQAMVRDADVISIQLGHSNVSAYGLPQIVTALGVSHFSGGDSGFGNDLSVIFTEDEISRAKPYAQRCIQKMALSDLQLRKLEEFIRTNDNSKIRKVLIKYLGEDIVESLGDLQKTTGDIVDTLMYMLISDMIHFDRMIERIREINPRARIFVVGLENPAPDLNITYTVGSKTVSLSLKKIAQPIFDIMNEYYRVYSEYSYSYYFVPAIKNNQTATYHDLVSRGSRTSDRVMREILTAYFSTTESYKDASEDVKAKVDALTCAALEIAKKKTINLNALLDSVSSIGQITDVLKDKNKAYDYILNKFVNKTAGAITEADYIIGQAWLLRMFNGIMVHPAQATHNAITEKLTAAMKSPRVNKDAIKYHIADRLLTCDKQHKKK